MNEMGLLLRELTNAASQLTEAEFDKGQHRCLMDDLHKLRGRLMAGARDHAQTWQRAKGTVIVTIEQGVQR